MTSFGSNFTMSRLVATPELHVGCMRLAPGGLVGLHQASGPQLFIVVKESGWIGDLERRRAPIAAGEAVLWQEGERHEAGSDGGLVAIVIEASALGSAELDDRPAELS